MKKKILLCDDNREYPVLLDRYIRNKGIDLSIYCEPDINTACEILEEDPSGILLISDGKWSSCPQELRKKIRKTGRHRFLSEERTKNDSEEKIYRYRPADEVVRRLLAAFPDNEGAEAKVTGVFSPSGGAAAEVCAELIAEMTAAGEKTAGLSFYPFSVYAGRTGPQDLSSILYRSAAGEDGLFTEDMPAGRLLAVSNPDDIWQLRGHELRDVVRKLKTSREADAVVIALPPLKQAPEILAECGSILLIKESVPGAAAAAGSFAEYAESSGADGIRKKMVSIELPPLPAGPDGAEWEGLLRHGSFFRQVREAAALAGVL